MRKILAAAAAASVMTAASIGSAGAFTSTGVIESLNSKANTVHLRNGDVYQLPANVDLSGLRPGQQVHVSWNTQNPSSVDYDRKGDERIQLLDATGIQNAD